MNFDGMEIYENRLKTFEKFPFKEVEPNVRFISLSLLID